MLEAKKITNALDLGGYDPAYTGQTVRVWVNPSAEIRAQRVTLLKQYAVEMARQKQTPTLLQRVGHWARSVAWRDPMLALMAALWSADEDADTHWTAAQVEQLQAADPLLYAWMARESWVLVDQFRDGKKK